MPPGNFYDLLQVDEAAAVTVVRVATRHLLSRQSGGSAADRKLREAAARACNVLTDPALRREYDSHLGIRLAEPSEREEAHEEAVAEDCVPSAATTTEDEEPATYVQEIALPTPPEEQRQARESEPISATAADAEPNPAEASTGADEAPPAEEAAASVQAEHAGSTAEIVYRDD